MREKKLDDMIATTVWIRQEDKVAIKIATAKRGISFSEFVRQAIKKLIREDADAR